MNSKKVAASKILFPSPTGSPAGLFFSITAWRCSAVPNMRALLPCLVGSVGSVRFAGFCGELGLGRLGVLDVGGSAAAVSQHLMVYRYRLHLIPLAIL